MYKLKLYKNNELVFEKNGTKKDDIYVFENINYNPEELILIREDNNFKYLLDFKNGEAIVTLKEKKLEIKLDIKVVNVNNNDMLHEIIYNIESDELSENKIIVELSE